MKQPKYIYRVINKWDGETEGRAEKMLNETNIGKHLHHIIEADNFVVFIWED